jgi:hypothetical protein
VSLFGKSDADMAKLMRRKALEHIRIACDVSVASNDRYAAVVMAEWALELSREYRKASAKVLKSLDQWWRAPGHRCRP